MILEKNIIQKIQKLWPDRWENIITYFKNKEDVLKKAPKNVQERMGKNYAKDLLLTRIKGREDLLIYEQEVLDKIIPKNKLIDGVTYLSLEGTQSLCRYVKEARWDIEKGMFWYTRTKFGHTFEDTMNHFGDVILQGIAGFTPIRPVD